VYRQLCACSNKEGTVAEDGVPLEVVVVDPSAKEGEAGAGAAAAASKGLKKGLCGGAPKEKKVGASRSGACDLAL
jgi:hypothetical protein